MMRRSVPWRRPLGALLASGLFVSGCVAGSVDGDRSSDQGNGPADMSKPPRNNAGPGGTGGSTPMTPGTPVAVAPGCKTGPTPLRRLTRAEYENTVRDLLGDKGSPAEGLPSEASRDGFDTDVVFQGASPLLAGGYLKAAERIAGRVDLTGTLACAPSALTDDCARMSIEKLGRRAYRRPLRAAEAMQLTSFYAANKATYGAEGAFRLTVQLILSAPQFLYRFELAPAAPGQAVALSPHEVASRLSYFLWGSMPDEPLFAAAEAGQLATKEQIGKQAERMLADNKARARMRDFFRQWLVLADLDDVTRDNKRYPGWSAALTGHMATESVTFAEKLLFDDGGTYGQLVSAPFSFMNKALATYLGVPAPAGTGFEKVMLDPAKYAGIVTHASVLAMNSKEDQPHPVYRGRWLRAQLLCHVPPPPPPSVNAQTPMLVDKSTTRAIFTQHSTDPACSGCHKLIDPIGFGLEQFDATGKWRANDRGLPIDTRGELVEVGDASGPFNGAVELGAKLAKSEHAAACLATQVFRYARGREEAPEDECALRSARTLFKEKGGNLRALMIAMTQTDDFAVKVGGK